MSIKSELEASFKRGDVVTKLIYINLAVFVLINLLQLISKLFVFSIPLFEYISVSSDPYFLLFHPWTLFSYAFVHEGFIHLLFNLLNLYWFGRFFLQFFNQKQLVGLYILGALAGALFYVVAVNLFPYFKEVILYKGLLIGASASVLAIITAVAAYSPNMEITLVLIGRVKLKYIAIVLFFISSFSVVGANAGGNLAHLGGIFAGYLFAITIKQGKDLTSLINKSIDFFVDLFARKSTMKVSYKGKAMSDASWNEQRKVQAEVIDAILDKIKKTGYESLTVEEKKKLFDQSAK